MKNQTTCFTGHRDISANERDTIQKRLESELVKLIQQDVTQFCAGGALGFDTIAAQTVLSLKEDYPQIKLIMVLPCREQTKRWSESDIKIYNHILQKTDKVVYTSEHYHRGCMHVRNRQLVDNASLLHSVSEREYRRHGIHCQLCFGKRT